MARLFKHRYTQVDKRTGQRVTKLTKTWYFEFKNERGKWVKVPGFRDKTATQRKALEYEHRVLQYHRGERPSRSGPAPAESVETLLAGYANHLTAKGDTERHVEKQRGRIAKLLAGVKADFPDEIGRGKVENWLAATIPGVVTRNHYARAAKAFCRWLVAEGKLPADPLAGLRLLNEETDRRRVRRALTDAEFKRLVAATKKAPPYEGITGRARALLYQMAAYTGLRRSELLSLTPASLNLAGSPPTATIEARVSKRRRQDVLPLPPWLAAMLRTHSRGLAATSPLWPAPERLRAAEMIAADLARAKIQYVDDRGRVFDFHALRSQFVTSLARAGVPLAAAQKLARHSR